MVTETRSTKKRQKIQSPKIQKRKNYHNTTSVSWESSVPARVGHPPALDDLSPVEDAANNRGPPTIATG
jgi:hypothetical protein